MNAREPRQPPGPGTTARTSSDSTRKVKHERIRRTLDEVVEKMLSTGLTAAGRIGEEMARAREKSAREAAAAEDQEGRELMARLEGERAAARTTRTRAGYPLVGQRQSRRHRPHSPDSNATESTSTPLQRVQTVQPHYTKRHEQRPRARKKGQRRREKMPRSHSCSQKPNAPTKPNDKTSMATTPSPSS